MNLKPLLLPVIMLYLLSLPLQVQAQDELAYNRAISIAKQADEFARKQDWINASAKYEEAIKTYPNYPSARKSLSYCYLQRARQMQPSARAAWYKAALDCDPENKEAQARLKELSGNQNNSTAGKIGQSSSLSGADAAASQQYRSKSKPANEAAASGNNDSVKGILALQNSTDELADQDRVPFRKDAHGYIVIKAEVESKQCEMVFDTGANVCMFGANHLKNLGVDTAGLAGETAYIRGATGSVIATRVLKLNLKIGKTSRLVSVYVHPSMPGQPLLGQNFLAGLQYEINNQLQVLLLRKAKAQLSAAKTIDPRDRNIVPFQMEGKSIVVPVEVCGKTVSMIFDTGADGVVFPAYVWNQLHLSSAKLLGRSVSMGVDGARPSYIYHVEKIDFGPVNLRDLHVTVIDPGPPRPLLGQKVLGAEKFYIDDQNQLIRFHR